MTDAYGTTIFCDDLRQEVGGKVSLMGCYGPDMIVGASFPATVRLAMSTRLFLRRDAYVGKEVRIASFVPGVEKAIGELVLSIPVIPDQEPSMKPDDYDPDAPKFVMLAINAAMGGVVIEKPGFVRVRAFVEGREPIRCGALNIRPPQTPEEHQMIQMMQPQDNPS